MLVAVSDYPSWWPQVRSVTPVRPVGQERPGREESADVAVRSVLPYTLRLVLTRQVEDPRHGILRVGVAGDLEGYAQWRLSGDGGGGTVAEFTEEVVVTGALGLVARPGAALMRANHRAMMRAGESGLKQLLSGLG